MATTTVPSSSSFLPAGPTLGVEEEFVLVDPNTGRPSLYNTEVCEAGHELGIDLQREFCRCQIETSTSVGTHIRDLRDQLCESRAVTADAAARTGCQLLAVGTPMYDPPPNSNSITDTPRYQQMAERFGALFTGVMCGCHVHVGIEDREQAVQVSNHLRPWLPALLALTANSPIAGGLDTGYASWRYVLFGRWPSAGPPPYFQSAQHYDDAVQLMLETGAILDTGMVYWDVRVSNHLPTVEIRISDVPATIKETMTLTTLVHALVMTAIRAIHRGESAPAIDQQVLRGACWLAARDGLAGYGLDPVTAHRMPAHRLVYQLLAHVKPALAELGEYWQVNTSLASVLDQGNGAIRQRQTLAHRGSVAEVISECARRTFEGCLPEPGNALPL
ncbi:glutamate--cysteine ligase [Rhodococcus sp. NPDC019627]|uniref:glutamate--cysteine ligase 2 n=1 Tax=unclassified Rhodococcus (in: high G+C Gram-positive bacteria) TaxID=192944 RepID=UPI0033E5BDB5